MVAIGLSTKGIEFDWKEGGNPIKPPPAGLEPHGDSGWYHSPDVVDPRDCQFYPDSPWCGGNPVDLSVGIQAEINVDPCGVTFDVSGQVGIKFPHRVETWRAPGKCRREYEAEPPPPEIKDYGLSAKAASYGFNKSISDDEEVIAGIVESYAIDNEYSCGTTPDIRFLLWGGYLSTGVSLEYSHEQYTDGNGDIWTAEAKMQYILTLIDAHPDVVCGRAQGEQQTFTPQGVSTFYFNAQETNTEIWTINSQNLIYQRRTVAGALIENRPERAIPPYYSFKAKDYFGSAWIVKGQWGDIKRYFNGLPERLISIDEKPYILGIEDCFDVLRPNATNPYKKNPPPSLEPRNCDCMQCCVSSPQTQNQQNNDALLRQILAEIKKANKAIGSDSFPAVFPKRVSRTQLTSQTFNDLVSILKEQTIQEITVANEVLTDIKTTNDSLGVDILPLQFPTSIKPDNTNHLTLHNAVEILNQLQLYLGELANGDNDLDRIKEVIGIDEFPATFPQKLTGGTGTVQIQNIPQLLKRQIIYHDELLGEYPIKIKIEDTDPTQEGNQEATLEFANTSEVLAEAFGAMMNVNLDTQILVQLATKALIELGITRKQLHTTQSMVDALCQHIGFASEEDTEEVPFTFTVPQYDERDQLTLEQFCKESTQKVEILKYKGKTTYMEDAAILRHMHGIIKGVFFRGIAKDAVDIAGAIKNIVKKQSQTMDKIAVGSTDDLENWAEDFELGFSGYTGGTSPRDPSKPYGLPLDQRPRIQIIRKPSAEPPTP